MTVPLVRVRSFLSESFPLELAEEWDNVGLLVGDSSRIIDRVMTCLTLTPDVADEAVSEQADLVVSHHPILFRPVQRLTADTAEGMMLMRLIEHGVAVYSPHTAFDSANTGINQMLAEGLGLHNIRPLRRIAEITDPLVGSGRQGDLTESLPFRKFLEYIRPRLSVSHLQYVSRQNREVSRVGVACGSAAEFLPDAHRAGCDVLITGEARFHACLEARELGIALVLAGHYGTERPGVERLASMISNVFPDLMVWASRRERDPIEWSLG